MPRIKNPNEIGEWIAWKSKKITNIHNPFLQLWLNKLNHFRQFLPILYGSISRHTSRIPVHNATKLLQNQEKNDISKHCRSKQRNTTELKNLRTILWLDPCSARSVTVGARPQLWQAWLRHASPNFPHCQQKVHVYNFQNTGNDPNTPGFEQPRWHEINKEATHATLAKALPPALHIGRKCSSILSK